jgi:2-polyprenyl-3-methyl-5-hydroxy-6-metoxy-1,4-benzoquinol methylase
MKELERQLEESWKTNAKAWTDSVRLKQIESRKVSTDHAVLNEIISLQPIKVLDVGCGEGWLAHALSEQGIEVVGIDGSEELVEKASSVGGGIFHHLNYSDFGRNPSKIGHDFDVAVCNFSILSEEITPIFQSLRSILSSNGVILIHTLHPYNLAQDDRYESSWKEESFSNMGEGYKSRMPWFYRTMGAWLNELKKAGLELQDCKEPIHPISGKPLSLLLMATPKIR